MSKALWKSIDEERFGGARYTAPVTMRPAHQHRKSKATLARDEEYRFAVVELFRRSTKCQCCPKRGFPAREAVDCHHVRGRAGKLLACRTYLRRMCRSCHQWCHEFPNEARKIGMLAKPGEWGKYP